MHSDWLRRLLVTTITLFILGLLRKYAPKPPSKLEAWRYDQRQVSEPFPSGAITAFMWAIGVALLFTFFVFKAANLAWARIDAPGMVHLYPTAVWWCFFPFFAALSIPWPLTLWLLRRYGRVDEADAIAEASNDRGQMNSFIVLKWMALGIAAPIGCLTLLAIPVHLSIGDHEARLGHYASVDTEIFRYDQARRAIFVDESHNEGGKIHRQSDLLIDFSDGRRLRANAVGDGGTSANSEVIKLLLTRTRLQPEHVTTLNDISPQ